MRPLTHHYTAWSLHIIPASLTIVKVCLVHQLFKELESYLFILWSQYHHVHQAPCISQQHADPVTYLFLRGALLRGYLGCLRRRRVLGRRKVGEVLIFFFLWLWTPFSTTFLAFRAFDLASVLAGTAWIEKYNWLDFLSAVGGPPVSKLINPLMEVYHLYDATEVIHLNLTCCAQVLKLHLEQSVLPSFRGCYQVTYIYSPRHNITAWSYIYICDAWSCVI